jgi:geranylgeranyl diphosphate synthase type II
MVGGQYADVSPHTPPGPAALRRLHELKTGRLISASVICVLLLGAISDEREIVPFRRFAAELGVLFQIVDDILDVTGTDDALGKPRGSDERHGKRTYVSQFGIERARELAGDSHRMALEALAEAAGESAAELPVGPAPQPPRLEGIVEHARGTALPSALRPSSGAPRATDELRQIADFIYTRTS